MKIGADYRGNGVCLFRVWTPWAKDMKLKLVTPEQKILQMEKDSEDYWTVKSEDISPGTNYFFRFNNGIDMTDPASNYQPVDVHSVSQVVDHTEFIWTDDKWEPIPLRDYIIYELHVGTFTSEGTFDSVINKIDHLKELGITVVEIMPVAQFPGDRNWGYDGVYPFAPQNTYGGPAGLKNLVNALHENEIAVILDVVYNHLGPEGNYLNNYGPYFTDKYKTPWGSSINFDGEYSDHVRNYFIENALYWLNNFHFDGLRLDAIDKIYDMGAKHFLAELAEEVNKSGKKKILIAESDLNDERIIRPRGLNGIGMDAQWSDDFHHSLHSLLTGEQGGYYADFGKTDDFAASLQSPFIYNGKYSVYRKRRHGNDPSGRDLQQFIVCLQNHDQVGNRAFGERISTLISFEAYKLASAILILSPFTPLIFMGQEFYAESPFIYFISHTNPELIKAVRKGRREEFIHFNWEADIPDPFSEETFLNSKIQWGGIDSQRSNTILNLYHFLISYRKNNPLYKETSSEGIDICQDENLKVIMLHWCTEEKSIYCLMNFEHEAVTIMADVPGGRWKKVLDTSSEEWIGPGSSTVNSLTGKTQNLTLKKESFILYESDQ